MSIIIIGFMGAGKSIVGKNLAKKLNMDFIDMDDEIEKREKCSISQIFENYGQNYFRKLESKLLEELYEKDNIIIATGGGIVTQKHNCNILTKHKKVIFLDADVETIIRNVSSEIDKRPLLNECNNVEEKVKELLRKRYDYYEKCSSYTIDVNNKNIDEVVSQILVYIR